MPLYLKVNPKIELAKDSSYKQKVWERIDSSLNSIVRSDMEEYSSGLPTLGVNGGGSESLALPFGGVTTAHFVHVQVTKECTLVLNAGAGGTDTITIKPYGAYPGIFVLHGEITGVTVENQDANNSCDVEYLIVGV